jgi:flagellar export protein FliJ
MTAFKFRLDRVLDYRRTLLQIAEAEFHRASMGLHSIQAQQAALASRKSETRKTYARLPEVIGRDLESLPTWFRWTLTESAHLNDRERAAEQELQKRREALVEAQRKVRLLERLREDRHTHWRAESDREIEELAADSTSSRFSRITQERPSPRSPSRPSNGTGVLGTCR